MSRTPKYVVISPVRNEGRYIDRTLESVTRQTLPPTEWIIVNDGSTDNTCEQVDSFSYIMAAFHAGAEVLSCRDWDFIVKLDGDLSFDEDYFERLLAEFRHRERLGIAGGTSYISVRGQLREEKKPLYYPPGLARTYRSQCYKEIGGPRETLGWDTIDIIDARMHGWNTLRFTDLPIRHLRQVSSRNGLLEGKLRTGRNFYITGYSPLFLIFHCARRCFEYPYIVHSLGILIGYCNALMRREKLVVTAEEKRYLRQLQHRRLLGRFRAEKAVTRGVV